MQSYLNEGTDLPLDVLSRGDVSIIVGLCKDQKSAIESVGRGTLSDLELAQLIAASIAVLGNESNYGSGAYYTATNWIENAYNDQGFIYDVLRAFGEGPKSGNSATTGPGQFNYGSNIGSADANPEMKQYAKKVGITGQEDLNDRPKAALAVIGKLAKAYNRAKKVGYSNTEPSEPGADGATGYDFEGWKKARSVNNYQGTGNAALDMALMSYKAGYSKIKNYKSLYPNMTSNNYLPCYGDACETFSGNDSLVYVSQAGKKFRNVISLVKSVFGIEYPESEIELPEEPEEPQESEIESPDSALTVTKQDIFGSNLNSWNNKNWKKFNKEAKDLNLAPVANIDLASSSWTKASIKLGYGKGTIRSAIKYYDDVKSGKLKVSLSEGLSRASLYRQRYGRY